MESSAYSIDFLQVLRSSWVIVLMLALSVVLVAITIERALYFRKTRMDSDAFMEKIKGYIVDGNYKEAIEYAKTMKGNVAAVVRFGLENRQFPREENDKLMEAKRMEERINLDHYLDIIGTLGTTSPFIGLLGTVLGIIKAFKDLASSAGGGPEVVMVGISEALIATAAGLAVAIPAVVIYNVFMKRVKTIAVEMDAVSKKLLVLLANYGEGASGRKRG
ncbi:MAG: MotA/TolQ/ExbB proton channel family protein [Spirochaetia bacterium]|nr:MotA/TolQ/ExbB proton channel family protein [Spirochaetia bacterium]